MAKCQIFWDSGIEAYKMKMEWDRYKTPQVVDFLKKLIPVSERKWDEPSKLWIFSEAYLEGTVKFIQLVYGNSECAVLTREQVEKSRQRQNVVSHAGSPLAQDCLEFLKLIGEEAMSKAFRHAAYVYHPDRGGDMTKLADINSKWTKIKKELYAST